MENNPYLQYKHTEVQTATPEKLILMLYEGGIKFLSLAKKALEEKDLEGANNFLNKSQGVVSELISSINFEAGQLAFNLHSLYTYMFKRLIDANISKSTVPVDEVLSMFTELKETWSEAMRKNQPINHGGINVEG